MDGTGDLQSQLREIFQPLIAQLRERTQDQIETAIKPLQDRLDDLERRLAELETTPEADEKQGETWQAR